MSSTTLKQIAISKRNYETLKKLGGAGDSFNDVISRLLMTAIAKEKEEEKLSCVPSMVTSPEGDKKTFQPPMTQGRSES